MESAVRGSKPPSLLREPRPDSAARLFCFPYSGCGASMYRQWPRTVGSAEVCLLQPPGRENRIREPHYGSYAALADQLADELGRYLDRPFAFFGHCGGALPAVELTLRLAERRLPTPARLFVSSQVAPQDGPFGRFLGLDDAGLVEELETLVRALGGQPEPTLIELSLTVLRADLNANRRYRAGEPPKLPCPITAIGWTHDDEVPIHLMSGWLRCSSQSRLVLLDGFHHDFLSAPMALLEELARGLAGAE